MRPIMVGMDVMVVSYQSPQDLKRFINSFCESQYDLPLALHVALVSPRPEDIDQAAIDMECVKVACSLSVYENNVGYARACNGLAATFSDKETLGFFNADTELRPGVLDHCHWHLHQNAGWGVLGPKQVDNKRRTTSAGVYGTNEHPTFDGRFLAPSKGAFVEVRDDCVSVSGSAYFVKRKCWDELTSCQLFQQAALGAEGAFLPTQHYYEEMYLSLHARHHGWKVVYDGRVEMIHNWTTPDRKTKAYTKPSREYFRKACDLHGIAHE